MNPYFTIGDTVHVTRGHYKGYSGKIISSSLNSVSVRSTAHGIFTVNRGDLGAGYAPVALPPAVKHSFRIGDRVKVTGRTHHHYNQIGTYKGVATISNSVADVDINGTSIAVYFNDLEKAPKRVIGATVNFHDIQVGDTITATYKNIKNGVKEVHTRTGVVAVRGPLTVRTAEGSSITISNNDVYTLDAIAPEIDQVLKDLKDYSTSTVVTFTGTLGGSYKAIKGQSVWALYGSTGFVRDVTTERLRELVREKGYRKVA